MRWSDFQVEQPRLAGLGRERLGGPGVVLVGTTRRDGTPRISPVEPLFWVGALWLSMMWGSHKAADLGRDPRILLHSIVTGRDGAAGEYKVRGRAVAESDPGVQSGYAREVRAQIGWDPVPGKFHLFWVDVNDVTFMRYDHATGDQFVTRWPRCVEFVRRGTSPTTVGDPSPYSGLLVAGTRCEEPPG